MDDMAAEQLGATAVQALLAGGTLAGSWTLDPARSEVVLKTRHTWGLLPLQGHFRKVAGDGTITADGQVSGVITVDADSVDTKNPRRDKHLRSADFFHVDKHPGFTYTVTGAAPAGDGVQVTGTLTVRDQTRPADFPAKVTVAGDEVTLEGELKVNRADYGLTWNFLGIAALDNTIVLHAVFTRG
jgi:polyisoprenoid-binding protein YceI